MKFFTSASAFAFLASLASSVSAVVIPGAHTPLFYFVSTSTDSSANLLVSLPSATCLFARKSSPLSPTASSNQRRHQRLLYTLRQWDHWEILFLPREAGCRRPCRKPSQHGVPLYAQHRLCSRLDWMQYLRSPRHRAGSQLEQVCAIRNVPVSSQSREQPAGVTSGIQLGGWVLFVW